MPGHKRYPEGPIYLFGVFVSAIALVAVIFLIPANLTITQVFVWGVIPLVGFVFLNQFVASRTRYPAALYAVGLLALFLRLALGIYMHTQVLEGNGFGNVFVKDDYYFFDQGVRVAESWLDSSQLPELQRSTEIGPIYFNASIVYVFGFDPRNVIAVQSIFGALSVVLSFFVARHFVSERKSLLVGFLLAVYPIQIFLAASNLRDNLIVFLTLVTVLLLLRINSEGKSSANKLLLSSLLLIAIIILALWRIYNALVLSFVILGWLVISSPRARFSKSLLWMAASILGIGLLIVAGVISIERLKLAGTLFGRSQFGRFGQLAEAQTFGFLANARGFHRFPYLIVTLPLSLVFGFGKFFQGHPDHNLLSLGYLWVWTPLLLPMFLGIFEVFRQNWKKFYFLWAISFGILLMSAISYFGLIPRYRTAAEPFLIIMAMLGLSHMRGVRAVYFVGALTFCAMFNILVWIPGLRIPLIVGLGMLAIVVMMFLAGRSLVRRGDGGVGSIGVLSKNE